MRVANLLAAWLLLLGETVVQAEPADTVPARPVPGTHNCANYYPEVARRRNESGGVLIHYDVQPDGRITDVFVLKGSGSEILDVAAVACVYERWRDLPATRHGFKVASRDHHALIRFALVGENPRQITSESPTMLFLIAALLAAASLALVPWIDRRPPQDESSRKPVD